MEDSIIRQEIVRFLEGEIPAGELEDRLENYAWDVDSEPARTLAADALRRLAEYADGDWTEAELREQLGAINRVYWFQQAPKVAWGHSTAGVIRHQQSEVADRSRVGGSA